MKRILRSVLPLVLSVAILLGSVVLPVQGHNPATVEQLNTYQNTGNQRMDIIGVAMTQLGYMEKYQNDTKYGDWYGLLNAEWCAIFVSWCARQAEVSTSIMKKNGWAHPDSYGIPYYHGSEYTPQPGDIFFTEKFNHTGIVLYTEGDFFYCIEGNARHHDYTIPHDPTIDSYHVMTNMRVTKDYYFGVPNYEGDEGHTYVRGHDSSHPHRAYYECTTCGDKYYTGYTDVVADCRSCFSCGCAPQYAGYYELQSGISSYLRIRSGHSMSNTALCYVPFGEVIYVYGINKQQGWAYIEYDGVRGHIPSNYLKAYPNEPAAPTATIDADDYQLGDPITVSWNTPTNTEQHRLTLYKDGQFYQELQLAMAQTHTLTDLPSGDYEARVTACNRAGASAPSAVRFTVRATYYLTYDPRGGQGAPEQELHPLTEAATLSQTIPQKTGYTFLGWTDNPDGSFANYQGGDTFHPDRDATVYAVWRSDDAQPETLTMTQAPTRTMYLQQEDLDTTGLALSLQYSDGSGHPVTEGFTVSGYDSETLGTKNLQISFAGLSLPWQVQVVPYIPGDLDNSKLVDRDDVIQLLWYISFPDRFAIDAPADFTDDGNVDRDDVIQLLWHITFPERFPLEIQWPETGNDTQLDNGTEGE